MPKYLNFRSLLDENEIQLAVSLMVDPTDKISVVDPKRKADLDTGASLGE